MNAVFADTFFWIALANPADEWHLPVQSFDKENPTTKIATTDEVLTEFLNYFSDAGARRRGVAYEMCEMALSNSNVEVIPQSHESFLRGLEMFMQRSDKGYSLTDCISMVTMKELGIDAVLTHDQHFAQEGFKKVF